ncbi:MAG TPA: DUF1501 domain-containing protein [Candidatus Acidoferrales bacterium]|nr:DUF1501 domain-containing protein [Candidatus Acidoferrales bacterium]
MLGIGRTFQPASGGGTDHAWGNVQMILGGAAQGADIYGELPTFALGGLDDVGGNGRWIPTTALDQFGATPATWFGVPSTDLTAVFPNLPNFGKQNLGFWGRGRTRAGINFRHPRKIVRPIGPRTLPRAVGIYLELSGLIRV